MGFTGLCFMFSDSKEAKNGEWPTEDSVIAVESYGAKILYVP